jgi:hypothetical protein
MKKITSPFVKSGLSYSKPLSYRFSPIKRPLLTRIISENRMGEGFGVRAFAKGKRVGYFLLNVLCLCAKILCNSNVSKINKTLAALRRGYAPAAGIAADARA